MDYREKASIVIKKYVKSLNEHTITGDLIHDVCELFDLAVESDIAESDYKFLKFISSEIGIPHYYDLLLKYKTNGIVNYNFSSLLSDIKNLPLHTSEESKLHAFQKLIIDKYSENKRNRFMLSAPTSFGKTYILYEIIKKMNYRNVLLIFPTIALLSENQMKLYELKKKDNFWSKFRIHTLSEDELTDDCNVWIFTPERYLSFLDNNPSSKFDFCFMDEIYKIDNQFIIDTETTGESERDISFRVALYFICERADDVLLAGPYISFPKNESDNCSIYSFLNDNGIKLLNFNNIEIVNKTNYDMEAKEVIVLNDTTVSTKTKNKDKNVVRLLEASGESEGTIIYCSKKVLTENRTRKLLKSNIFKRVDNNNYSIFLNHIKDKFSDKWIVYKGLECGIGIHHGLIPKYIQKDIIKYFNLGIIKCIFSTTTITEGINTCAKNMVVYDCMKGNKSLKQFDAKNIAGRAGRFMQHFSGRVITLCSEFLDILRNDSDCIKHIDYDCSSKKQDADLDITNDKYLTTEEKSRKRILKEEANRLGLSDLVLSQFKTINKKTKIEMYKKIINLPESVIDEFKKIGIIMASYGTLYFAGFDILIKIISDFVTEVNLKNLIDARVSNDSSLMTCLVKNYLEKGFFGIMNYRIKEKNESVDAAIRNAANLNFNIFKYQLTKYLGMFDLLLRYRIGKDNYKDVTILGSIVQKLEYGYLNDKARKANDYGVPFNILSYYETNNEEIKNSFDDYEKTIFQAVDSILK